MKTGSKLPNSMIDLTTTNIEMKIDPFIELSIERVKIIYFNHNKICFHCFMSDK